MLHPLFQGLDMAIEHGRIGTQPVPVRGLRHLQPFFPWQFFVTGQLPDPGVEDLGPASRQRTEPRLLQNVKGVGNRFASKLSQMGNFDTGEGLDVDRRPDLFNPMQEIKIVTERQIRMKATDHMNLGDRLIQTVADLLPDLVDRHLIGEF